MYKVGLWLIVGVILGTTQGWAMGSIYNKAFMRQEKAIRGIEVSGQVSCAMEVKNHGDACKVSLKESETGKTYWLRNADSVRSLYFSGKKQVKVTGQLDKDDVIRVKTAEEVKL